MLIQRFFINIVLSRWKSVWMCQKKFATGKCYWNEYLPMVRHFRLLVALSVSCLVRLSVLLYLFICFWSCRKFEDDIVGNFKMIMIGLHDLKLVLKWLASQVLRHSYFCYSTFAWSKKNLIDISQQLSLFADSAATPSVFPSPSSRSGATFQANLRSKCKHSI